MSRDRSVLYCNHPECQGPHQKRTTTAPDPVEHGGDGKQYCLAHLTRQQNARR